MMFNKFSRRSKLLVFWGAVMVISFFNYHSFAQNLIPDPGFEIWDGTIGPKSKYNGGALTHWYNANGTPDHHHELNPPGDNLTSLTDCPTGNGNTDCGEAYEGQGVLGCWKGNGPDGSREWAGIQLSEPMVAGVCYEISFWIQNKEDELDYQFVSNQWGMYFDHTQVPFFNPNLANYAAMADHWVACEQVIEGSEWQKVEFDYQASEDFEYAYIGFMGDFSTSTYSVPNDDYLLGYYVWIDEVIITRIDPQLTVSEDISICPGETVTLEATSNFPVLWEDNDSSVISREVSPDATTVYYVHTLDSTLCTQRDSIIVTVIEKEEINYAGSTICEGATPFILDPNLSPGTWSGSGIIDASQGLFDPKLSGSGTFAITYLSDADCSQDLIINIEVLPPPIVDFDADIMEGCPPLNIEFTNLSPQQGVVYNWDFGNGTSSLSDSIATATYEALGSYDVSLEIEFSEHCRNSQNIPGMIEIFEPPVADFSTSPANPSNLSSQVQFNDLSTGNLSEWYWNFGNGDTSDKNNATTVFELPGLYDVHLAVTSINGCVDSLTRQITVNSIVNFYVPNAFSPNDDGINDLFEIYYVGPLQDYKLTIFDRWGGTIFSSKNGSEFWNGDLPDGDKADVGVYTYLLEYNYAGIDPENNLSGTEAGDVILLR
jgi:gliding motility-associated-like protein